MKAIEILDALIREGIDCEQCGVMSGERIINAGPYRMFGVRVSGKEIKADHQYLYYYGADDELFCFLPSEHIVWEAVARGEAIHLWEIDD